MWYACFGCVVEPEPLPANDKAVALDVGLCSFVTLQRRNAIGNPRLFRKAQKRVCRAQRRVAPREKSSKRWKKAVRQDSPQSLQPTQRFSALKLSREIVNNYGILFVEDLNVKRSVPWAPFEAGTRCRMGSVFSKTFAQGCECGTKVLARH